MSPATSYDLLTGNHYTVLDLPMFEGTGNTVRDISKQHHNGTITGATWVTLPSGLNGISIAAPGDNVDCGNIPELQSSDTVAFEFWFKSTALGSTGRVLGTHDSFYLEVFVYNTTNLLYLSIYGIHSIVSSYSLISTINFQHWVCYFKESTGDARIYLNGSLDNSSTTTLKRSRVTATPFRLGTNSVTPNHNCTFQMFLPRAHAPVTEADLAGILGHFSMERDWFGV
jgi:hypothetical protein